MVSRISRTAATLDILSRLTAQKGRLLPGKQCLGIRLHAFSSRHQRKCIYTRFSPYKRRDIGQAVPYHYFDEIPAVLKHHSFDLAIEVFKTARLQQQMGPIRNTSRRKFIFIFIYALCYIQLCH